MPRRSVSTSPAAWGSSPATRGGSPASREQGVGSVVLAKTALTAAALGATASSRVLGRTVSAHTAVAADSGTEPAPQTPADVASAQKQLAVLQWVVPGITGALV